MLEGIQLHDLGDYPGAIRRFEQILAENPDDIGALYELSHTLMVSKEYKRSLEVAMRGAEYDSATLPDLYSLIGSDLDELGDQKRAIAVYEEGIKRFPGNAVLPFNLGITYLRMQRPDDSRKLFQTALRADATHASSHYRLAALYVQGGYGVPGILAALRFLELARDTRRCKEVLQFVLSRVLGGAEAKDGNKINVTINLGANDKSDEGDFNGPAALLALGAALQFTDEGKKLSRPQLLLKQFEMVFETFENNKDLRKDKKRFAAAFYAPYFRELYKAGHAEAFTYTILRQSGWPEVEHWQGSNAGKMEAYAAWSQAYAWPVATRK